MLRFGVWFHLESFKGRPGRALHPAVPYEAAACVFHVPR